MCLELLSNRHYERIVNGKIKSIDLSLTSGSYSSIGVNSIDVSDCVSGLIDIPVADKNIVVEAYNLANNETIKVKDMAPIIVDEMGIKNVKYKFSGGDRGWIGDVPITILSFEKAKKIGWSTTISLEEAVRRTVRYLFDGK